jgi:Galactosyltransferase
MMDSIEKSGTRRRKARDLLQISCIAAIALHSIATVASWTKTSVPVLDEINRQPRRKMQSIDSHYRSTISGVNNMNSKISDRRHSGRLRVLIGITTADFENDIVYRKRHRALFRLWNDTRVCTLTQLKQELDNNRCQLIYTFVAGGNPDASTVLLDGSRSFEVSGHQQHSAAITSQDYNRPDMTLLNIRENMNDGKSQTWMAYGAQLARKYDIDYVGKCDTDTLLHLHEFFHFAYRNLPPAPYNHNLYVGALRDKAYWPQHSTAEERVKYESYFGIHYEGVHLYVAGQFYILSSDLATFVGDEAKQSRCDYCELHEDHDIASMAFHRYVGLVLLLRERMIHYAGL